VALKYNSIGWLSPFRRGPALLNVAFNIGFSTKLANWALRETCRVDKSVSPGVEHETGASAKADA